MFSALAVTLPPVVGLFLIVRVTYLLIHALRERRLERHNIDALNAIVSEDYVRTVFIPVVRERRPHS